MSILQAYSAAVCIQLHSSDKDFLSMSMCVTVLRIANISQEHFMLLPKCVFNYNIIDKSNGSVHAGITVFMIAIQNNRERKNYNSSL